MSSRPAPEAPERTSSRSSLFVVFTTILIDFIGFSVLIPVLPLYAEKLGATPVQVEGLSWVHSRWAGPVQFRRRRRVASPNLTGYPRRRR